MVQPDKPPFTSAFSACQLRKQFTHRLVDVSLLCITHNTGLPGLHARSKQASKTDTHRRQHGSRATDGTSCPLTLSYSELYEAPSSFNCSLCRRCHRRRRRRRQSSHTCLGFFIQS
ncbi:hypothetical protein QR685DRAFT_568973 [Neurospora intermedia]|uniref:Questionable protein n=1 Tax=Neurospora intermedia TaxID=5142 RepID=A0ABR3DJE4_NEUIN